MKKPEEYYNEFIYKLPSSQRFRKFIYSLDKNELIDIIKQIQSKTIEETVKLCAKNAYAEEGYIGYSWIVNEESILDCAEILKKEIE